MPVSTIWAYTLSKLTATRKKKFLDELAQAQSVSAAARFAGVSRQAFYQLREHDKTFQQAWDDAREQGMDALEDEAVRRALVGSDLLLIFLLKGAMPEKYRDNVKVETDMTIHLESSLNHGMKRVEELRNGHYALAP